MLSCPDPLIVASSHLISCSVPSFTQQFYTHTLIHNSYSNTAHTDHSSEGSACCSRSIGLVEAQHGDNMTEAAAKFLTAQIGVTPVAASIRALDTLLEEAAGGRCGACQVVVEALVDEIDLWEQVRYDHVSLQRDQDLFSCSFSDSLSAHSHARVFSPSRLVAVSQLCTQRCTQRCTALSGTQPHTGGR